MNDEDLLRLAHSIAAEQALTFDEALEEAKAVTEYDPDIVAAAVEWITTGKMPNAPEVDGDTPKSLQKYYYPTQIFDMLQGLRHNLEETKRGLRHFPTRDYVGPDKRVPNVDLSGLNHQLDVLAKESRELYDDASAVGLTALFVEQLNQHRIAVEKVRDKLEDDLQSKNRVPLRDLYWRR
jgi:hypothetical protein